MRRILRTQRRVAPITLMFLAVSSVQRIFAGPDAPPVAEYLFLFSVIVAVWLFLWETGKSLLTSKTVLGWPSLFGRALRSRLPRSARVGLIHSTIEAVINGDLKVGREGWSFASIDPVIGGVHQESFRIVHPSESAFVYVATRSAKYDSGSPWMIRLATLPRVPDDWLAVAAALETRAGCVFDDRLRSAQAMRDLLSASGYSAQGLPGQ